MTSPKPLLIYDGKCAFCRIWIDYWRKLTGDRIAYAASQEVGDLYPQIPREDFARGVQLVRPDGTVVKNAEAVFASLQWERFYSPVAEPVYRFIATHRDLFYFLTQWTFGTRIEPARFARTQWIFVRVLAAIYAIAFGSLLGQIRGLMGAHGILPVATYFKAVAESSGVMRFWYVPSLLWIDSSDAMLVGMCWAGVLVSMVVLAGFFERAGLAILFVLYLSLSAAGQDFLSFQWDSLLIETGFLAIFLGNSRVVVWLFRWLLFRLMFLSGAVKWLSHDAAWSGMTALSYHFWTQPLPNRMAWYVAQLPGSVLRISTAVTLVVEVVVPFFIFLPRRMRIFGAWWLVGLQVLIFCTGNYTFFNLLALGLCLFLFDDRDFEWWGKARTPLPGGHGSWRRVAVACLAALILGLGGARMVEMFFNRPIALVKYMEPFEIVNSYGLFAVMTTSRPEIMVEGSRDGENWTAYSFRYKPGNVARAPRWAAPYQPRLDWQMWFAALGNYRENPWFVNFAVKLLEGSPEVTGLLEADPFGGRPPRYVRALLYDYTFTDLVERRQSGDWWKRELRGEYLPPVGLKSQSLNAPKNQ